MKTLIQRTAALQRRLGTSFDLVYRSIQIQSVQAEMIFLSSLTDARLLAAITESFVVSAKDGLQVTLYPGAVEQVWDEEAAITSLLSGQCMVLLENDASWYCVEVRSYPSRPSAEPSVERSIRGSHDGFVENTTFLVIAYNINKTDPENQEKLNRLAAYAKDKGYRFYGLSASAADDIRKYTEAHQVNYDYCSTDEIQLKTIVRSNPGLILLRQGTILDKWGHRDLPEVEELQNKDLASYCLQEQQAITDRYLIYSLIMLYIACIFLYIIRKYKRMIK